jgi:uncharacterized protein YlxW (UPF0749 family)
MFERTPQVPSDSPESDSIDAALQRLSKKIQLITGAIKTLNQERSQLENKIEDAQKRVQRILSRIPDKSDGRQLNLLGEATPPTNIEEDNEPTTH